MDRAESSAAPDVDLLEIQVWNQDWAELARRIGPVFARAEARTRAMAQRAGLLSPVERKNSWQLAEVAGATTPYGFQHLLGWADWDPHALRDRLRTYLPDYLATPDAVGVLDEIGLLKQGTHAAGVARHYRGTAGRVENCQIGVFLAYATAHAHTLLDQELQLPKAWTDDRERCRRAGIPEERPFATKPARAIPMLERTRAGGVTLAWVTRDCSYGDDRKLRRWLAQHAHPYVLAVSGKASVWRQQRQQRVTTILAALPPAGWARISAGVGSTGARWDAWLRLDLQAPRPAGRQRWVVVRRRCSAPDDLTAQIAYAPATTTVGEQVRVAGMRWTVAASSQTAQGAVGLDHSEVRRWTGWYRHITLALWAQAFLAVVRAETGAAGAPKKGRPTAEATSSLAAFKAHRGLRSA